MTLEDQFFELVKNIVDIIQNKYKDNMIFLWTPKNLFNEKYINLTKFLEYDQVDKTIFALWALQNSNNVEYDIVYAQSASESKLAMVFHTDASAGFYFDPTSGQKTSIEPFDVDASAMRKIAPPKIEHDWVLVLEKAK